MNRFNHSTHSRQRQNERGISDKLISLVLANGSHEHSETTYGDAIATTLAVKAGSLTVVWGESGDEVLILTVYASGPIEAKLQNAA